MANRPGQTKLLELVNTYLPLRFDCGEKIINLTGTKTFEMRKLGSLSFIGSITRIHSSFLISLGVVETKSNGTSTRPVSVCDIFCYSANRKYELKQQSKKGCVTLYQGQTGPEFLQWMRSERLVTVHVLLNEGAVPAPMNFPLPGERMWKAAVQNKFTDATFKVEGREFKAHKAVLSAASPVFDRMFSGDFEEARTGVVEVKDMSADVFENFLMFIYTGRTKCSATGVSESLTKYQKELFYAADKYGVESLRMLCDVSSLCSLEVVNCLSQMFMQEFGKTLCNTDE